MITHRYRLPGEALADSLTNVPDFAVVGHASDGESAFRLARQSRPAVVLLDLDTFGQPEHTVRQLVQLAPTPRIIILSGNADPGFGKQMLALGAHGYLHKAISRQDLVLAIHQIVRSCRTMTVPDSPGGPLDAPWGPLTEREREVLALVAKALSNRQIAIKLRITEGTVKRHLRNIFGKLGAVSRIDAVNKAGASLAEAGYVLPVPCAAARSEPDDVRDMLLAALAHPGVDVGGDGGPQVTRGDDGINGSDLDGALNGVNGVELGG
jgi:DNA-binding NarL/FixJ family response regulator